MTSLFLRLYYALMSFVVFSEGRAFLNNEIGLVEHSMAIQPLSHLSMGPSFFIFGFSTTLILSFICCLRLSRGGQALFGLSFLVMISLKNSMGDLGHSHHMLVISSLIVPLLNKEKSLLEDRNLLIGRLIQSFFLSHYFISGVWKLRDTGFFDLFAYGKEIFAVALIKGKGPSLFIEEFFLHQAPWLLTLGFFLVLFFQLSSFLPIIRMRWFKTYGVLACLFHLFTGLILSIWYQPNFLTALLFLIIFEFFLDEEVRLDTMRV